MAQIKPLKIKVKIKIGEKLFKKGNQIKLSKKAPVDRSANEANALDFLLVVFLQISKQPENNE